MAVSMRNPLLVAAGATLLVSLVGLQVARTNLHDIQTEHPSEVGFSSEGGTTKLAVFVGSADCVASNHADLPNALQLVRERMSGQANDRGDRFLMIGVSVNNSPEDGLEHLASYGYGLFDEVSSGGGWLNSSILRFLLRDQVGSRVTPQLILAEYDVGMVENNGRSYPQFSKDRIISRYFGYAQIMGIARAMMTETATRER